MSSNVDSALGSDAAGAHVPVPTSCDAVCARLIEEVSLAVDHSVAPEDLITGVRIDSVTAIQIMFRMEEEFGLVIGPAHLAEPITFAELARQLVTGEEPKRSVSGALDLADSRRCVESRPVDFSLMYFATDTQSNAASYEILLRSARYADQHGFKAVWLPERHFHAFGGTYPNPAVAAAAISVLTTQLRIRAGSVVLPLHASLRVAEEWSFVDNLSGGRVDLAFATGWNPNDFVLAPDAFASRRPLTLERIEEVQRLWRGESCVLPNGRGEPTTVTTHPRPVQRDFSVWLTCTGSDEGFADAGRLGYNVLTALLFQRPEALARKLQIYRSARERAGHDPRSGLVTLMLHTFVAESMEAVRAKVATPFKRYLASSVDLWQREWTDLATLNEGEREKALDVAFERYARGNALFGTPESCAELVKVLQGIGVDEIACLVDFGVGVEDVIASLEHLDALRRHVGERSAAPGAMASTRS